jgi:hypothetical protein
MNTLIEMVIEFVVQMVELEMVVGSYLIDNLVAVVVEKMELGMWMVGFVVQMVELEMVGENYLIDNLVVGVVVAVVAVVVVQMGSSMIVKIELVFAVMEHLLIVDSIDLKGIHLDFYCSFHIFYI